MSEAELATPMAAAETAAGSSAGRVRSSLGTDQIEAEKQRALAELRLVEQELLLLREAGWTITAPPLGTPERPLVLPVPTCSSVPMAGAVRMQLRVLVVEDQPFQQEAIRTLLAASSRLAGGLISFDVDMCSCAEEAHATLRRRRDYHAVLLDVVMPDINGDDLLPSLRSMLGEQVAVVMASAYGQLSLMQRCIMHGADSFMTKPLQLQSVSQIWQQQLQPVTSGRTAAAGSAPGRAHAPRRLRADASPRTCLLYTSPSPRDRQKSRMPSSA